MFILSVNDQKRRIQPGNQLEWVEIFRDGVCCEMIARSKNKFPVLAVVISAILVGTIVVMKRFELLVDESAQEPVRTVIKAERWSKITGDYWEDTMETEYSRVSNDLATRVEFLKGIVIYTELKPAPAMLTFIELAKSDPGELRESLVHFRSSAKFQRLTKTEKERVNFWIPELLVIEDQRSFELQQQY